ncbi:MAG TPA: ChbG/HpnK family deacetylase [Flavobacteriales bacterium]|nr:ChbG/HpnK family deacetylase [Flavobacteriales bacterium]
MKGIIVNADDFGPSPFINRGIIDGIEKGVINSVSAFVTFNNECMDNISALKKRIDEEFPHVKIGLHVSLTAGQPVHDPYTAVSSICYKRKPLDHFCPFKDIDVFEVDKTHLEAEIRAQVNRLGKALGGIEYIDHINSHLGIFNFYMPFWEAFTKITTEYNFPMRNPISAEHKRRILPPHHYIIPLPIEGYALKQGLRDIEHPRTVLELIKGTNKNNLFLREADAISKKIKMPAYFITHYYGKPGFGTLRKIVDAVQENEVVELMVHVGRGSYAGENFWGIDNNYYNTRIDELNFLVKPDFRNRMRDKGVEFANYPR